jgi:hypothetical protein
MISDGCAIESPTTSRSMCALSLTTILGSSMLRDGSAVNFVRTSRQPAESPRSSTKVRRTAEGEVGAGGSPLLRRTPSVGSGYGQSEQRAHS